MTESGHENLKCDVASKYLFVNGELFTAPEATVFDRIGGESVYEVIKLLGGVPLFFEDHMDRLRRSMALLGIKFNISNHRIRTEINCLTEKTDCRNINVKLVWTPAVEESMFLTYFIQQDIPAIEDYQKGVHTILFSAERKNPHVKAIQTSFRERAATTRDTTGAYEALLVDGSGYISEGARSNIFYLLDNQLCTPPSGSVLLGVTRQHVMSICREIGLKIRQRKLHRDDLNRLAGAFITGTTIDVLPVRSIESVNFDSAVHPTIVKIAKAFDKHVTNYVKKQFGDQRSLL